MKREDDLEAISELAALHALGKLPADEAQRFELRLESGCAFCMSEYAAFAAVVEELPACAPLVSPPASLRERVLQVTRGSKGEKDRDVEVVRGDAAPWVQSPVPGVEVCYLRGQGTLMVRMQPGASYPTHRHDAAEQCLVLQGSITDRLGLTVRAGDFVCMPAGSVHSTIHTDDGCTFLVTYTN